MKTRFQSSIIPWLQAVKRRTRIGMIAVFLMSILLMVLFFSCQILSNSKRESEELGVVIGMSLRSLMMDRDENKITEAFQHIQAGDSSISGIFLLDRTGKVTISADPAYVGRQFDRNTDPSCIGCHAQTSQRRDRLSKMVRENGSLILRAIAAQENKPECQGCHDATSAHNGKIVVDRSAAEVLAPIIRGGAFLLAGGLLVTLLVTRILHYSFERYLRSFVRQERQLQSLYELITQLSNLIDVEELRELIADILRDTFALKSVDVILPSPNKEWRWVSYDNESPGGERRKFPVPEDWAPLVEEWKTAKKSDVQSGNEGRELFLRTAFAGAPLALFAIRKADGAFDTSEKMLAHMMTEHIAASLKNAYLYHLAVTDDLTRLFARRHFDHCLSRDLLRAETQGQQVGLCLLDIDHFKAVNDVHGHSVGDQVLREVALRLMLNLRSMDQAFRFGGEEIAVIAAHSSMQTAAELAERLREIMEGEPFTAHRLPLTVSIGVACSNGRRNLSPRVLFEEADSALYRAKNAGRNRVERAM